MSKHVWVCLTIVGALAFGQADKPQNQPDNSARNKQDRHEQSKTAEDQGGTQAERDVAAAIRKHVVGEKALSTYAQNAKVIVRDGQITLRGPVRTQMEKQRLEEIAKMHSGERKVVNDLEIAPEKN
jgi:hyperosmotically inducible periplasmic protein